MRSSLTADIAAQPAAAQRNKFLLSENTILLATLQGNIA